MNDHFKILGVGKTADKREILTKAMALLHQDTPYDARSIAEAQKILFSPLLRAEAEFMCCLDVDFEAVEAVAIPGEEEIPTLTLLELFHAEKGTT